MSSWKFAVEDGTSFLFVVSIWGKCNRKCSGDFRVSLFPGCIFFQLLFRFHWLFRLGLRQVCMCCLRLVTLFLIHLGLFVIPVYMGCTPFHLMLLKATLFLPSQRKRKRNGGFHYVTVLDIYFCTRRFTLHFMWFQIIMRSVSFWCMVFSSS